MNIAIILAGGYGTRISGKIPKQLIKIADKPILIHTIEIFLLNDKIKHIIIVCNKKIISEVNDLIKFYWSDNNKKIDVIEGGETRNHSILMAYNFLNENYNLNNKDIIITHDAVRMFVNKKLINDSIKSCMTNHIIIPTIDIVDSICKIDENNITMINRNTIKIIQTPQTLHYETFKLMFEKKINLLMNPDWDLCWLSNINKVNILNIKGLNQNIKITTDFDLFFAKNIYQENQK